MSPPDSGMIAPLPNCFSMAAMAPATAFSFSFMLDMGRSWVSWLVDRERGTGAPRRGETVAIAGLPSRSAMVRATRRTRVMARADSPRRATARSSSAWPAPSSGATRRSSVDDRRAFQRWPARLLAARAPRSPGRGPPRWTRPVRRGPARGRAAPGRRRAGRCDRAAAPTAATGTPPPRPARRCRCARVLPRWPHGQGLSAATSMKSAG